MDLSDLLLENKLTIMSKWVDVVMSTYPKEGAKFFSREKDRFANPLGYSAEQGLEKSFNLLMGSDEVEVPSELQQFVKLRAVQTFTAAEAVSFVYQLKKVVVTLCGKDAVQAVFADWLLFEERIDALALAVFNLFMADRERLCQIKVNEYKTGNHITTAGQCPSVLMRKNKEEKLELKAIRDC